jgi:hypothetical protein
VIALLISQMLSLCVVCCASCVVLLLSVHLFYGVLMVELDVSAE